MKRLLTYLIAILIFPQVISAVILVHKPKETFSVSQTYVIPHKGNKGLSCAAPDIWKTYNRHKQSKSTQMLARNTRLRMPVGNTKCLAKGKMAQNPYRRLAQAE